MLPRRQYWLLKSEPTVFSFDDLCAAPDRTAGWDGVRNYQARNSLRSMRAGDLVFFYHSNAQPPGIVGIAEIVREAYPDATQFDRAHEHFDPKSKPQAPAWLMVDLRAVEPLPRVVGLDELRSDPELVAMQVCQKGSRLSVQAVSSAEWGRVRALAKRKLKL